MYASVPLFPFGSLSVYVCLCLEAPAAAARPPPPPPRGTVAQGGNVVVAASAASSGGQTGGKWAQPNVAQGSGGGWAGGGWPGGQHLAVATHKSGGSECASGWGARFAAGSGGSNWGWGSTGANWRKKREATWQWPTTKEPRTTAADETAAEHKTEEDRTALENEKEDGPAAENKKKDGPAPENQKEDGTTAAENQNKDGAEKQAWVPWETAAAAQRSLVKALRCLG